MIRLVLISLAVLTLAACETETRVIRDNSANAKFARLVSGGSGDAGGEAVNGGWSVMQGGKPLNSGPDKPPTETQLRIAELLRQAAANSGTGGAHLPTMADNPAGLHITTSDDSGAGAGGGGGQGMAPSPIPAGNPLGGGLGGR